jgi:hypothetical protein
MTARAHPKRTLLDRRVRGTGKCLKNLKEDL